MNFWTKMKEVLAEVFSKKVEEVVDEPQTEEVALEEQPVNEPAQPATESSEPVVESEPAPVPEPAPEPVVEPANEPQEAPNVDNSKLEELIGNLKAEIEALKQSNEGLQEKIKDMGKQPSVAPVNTNAKPSAGDTYSAWREQMAKYL